MITKEEQDKLHDRMRASKPSELFVAEVLKKWAYEPERTPHSIAPDYDSRLEHSDKGDLWVKGFFTDAKEICEAHKNFTGSHDFKYPQVLVDNVGAYDRKEVKPRMHVILSPDWMNMIVVYGNTFHEWWKAEFWAPLDKTMKWGYFCTKKNAHWHKVPEGLEEAKADLYPRFDK